jgi:hypothetical protein
MMQAMSTDLNNVASIMSSNHDYLWKSFASVNMLVIFNCAAGESSYPAWHRSHRPHAWCSQYILSWMSKRKAAHLRQPHGCADATLFILTIFALSLSSRHLTRIIIFAIPVISALTWVTLAVTFGFWIVAKDICAAAARYPALSVNAQIASGMQTHLVPCINVTTSAAMEADAKSTYVALTQAVNDIISSAHRWLQCPRSKHPHAAVVALNPHSPFPDIACTCAAQYDLPVMAQFTDDPLVCEAYQVNNETGTIAAVTCPYPSALHRYDPETWEPNNSGLRCIGNSNTQCAADKTPLTATVFNAASQILTSVSMSAALADAAKSHSTCQASLIVMTAAYDGHCTHDDIRESLRGAWVALVVAGVLGSLAYPVLYVLHDATAPAAKMSISSVYGPGVVHDSRPAGPRPVCHESCIMM